MPTYYTKTNKTTSHINETVSDGSLIIGTRTDTETKTIATTSGPTKYVEIDEVITHKRGFLRAPFLFVYWLIILGILLPVSLYVVIRLMGVNIAFFPAYSLYVIGVLVCGNVYITKHSFHWFFTFKV